jgi:hypothetical protein
MEVQTCEKGARAVLPLRHLMKSTSADLRRIAKSLRALAPDCVWLEQATKRYCVQAARLVWAECPQFRFSPPAIDDLENWYYKWVLFCAVMSEDLCGRTIPKLRLVEFREVMSDGMGQCRVFVPPPDLALAQDFAQICDRLAASLEQGRTL